MFQMAAPSGKDQNIQAFRHRLRAHPFLGAIVIFVVLLLLLSWGAQVYVDSLEGQDRIVTDRHLMVYRNGLENSLYSRIVLVRDTGATVEGQVESTAPPDFYEILFITASSNPAIQDISIAPGGVVEYQYSSNNPTGNPRVDLVHSSDPEVRTEVARALESNDVVVGRPMTHPDGSQTLVIRKAIRNESEVWGILTVTFDLSPLLQESLGPGNTSALALAIRDGSGEVFYGDPAVFGESPVIRRISVQDGFWDFAATPPGGWDAAVAGRMGVFWAGGLATLFLVSGLVFLGISSHSSLTRAVKERTRDLEQEKATLKKMNRALEVISEYNSDLVKAKTEPELLQQICDILVTSGDYPFSWVGSLSPRNHPHRLSPLVCARSPGVKGEDIFSRGRDLSREESIAEQAVAKSSPVIMRCPEPGTEDPLRTECALCPDCRSLIALSLLSGDPSPLVLVIYSTSSEAFDNEEVALLLQLSADLSFGVRSIRTRVARDAAEKELLVKGYALNSSVSGIALANLDGRFTYVNDSFLKMFGYTRAEEVLGNSIFSFDPRNEFEKELIKTIIDTTMKDGGWIGQVEPVRRDGTKFYADLLVNLVHDGTGTPLCMMASFIDVSDMKNAEERIAYQGRLLSEVAEAIVTVDENFRITSWSPKAVAMFGWERDEATGKKLEDLLRSQFPGIEERENYRASREKGVWYGQTRQRKKDGTLLYVDLITIATRDPDHKIDGYVNVMHDVTDRVRIEELKREAFSQIDKNFMQMAILNDEIRNPLSVIVGLASLEGGETGEKIIRQAEEINAIITQLDQGWIESAKVREFMRKHYGAEEERRK
ncbi:PAS domain S-box-containing protein [Methanolinea mesophila]|nr:PAS domain S-box-containing protein [Methanolinea mesophila]